MYTSGGQGRPGSKKPVLFPKIVFLIRRKPAWARLSICEDVFEAGVECSAKTMYPDWLSMTGEGYIAKHVQEIRKGHQPDGLPGIS